MNGDQNHLEQKQLDWAYWWLSHQLQIKKALMAIFIAFDSIVWVIFLTMLVFYLIRIPNERALYESEGQAFQNNVVLSQLISQGLAQKLVSSGLNVFRYSDGRLDIMAKINNPNPDWYAVFDYQFIVGDKASDKVTSFILPGGEKYLMAFNIKALSTTANLEVSDIRWQRILKKDIPDIKSFIDERSKLEISDIKHEAGPEFQIGKENFAKTTFSVYNNTAYNYWETGYFIVLYQQSKPVAINYVKAEQLKSGEKRSIVIGWPGVIPVVSKVEIIPEVDIFDSSNYMEISGVGTVK